MILIIDDDSAIRTSLSLILKRSGYEVTAVSGPREAMDMARDRKLQLILMDMNFSLSTSGEEGLTLLKQIKLFQHDTPVILMTAWGSIELAVKGMQAGAFDFITKPWNNAALIQRVETALQLTSQQRNDKGNGQDDNGFDRSFIIGKSPQLTQVLETVRRIARTNAPVLITGESGTGKELIAEAIHRNSLRASRPFVKVNLGGISQSLFESEMFGHRKGAFTDAVTDRTGRFEMADSGTIFLDEIGELDLSCQVKLLRVLQDQTFERLGDSKPHKVDVRVICATNANLQQMVRQHTFREDLFYRINLISIHLPALRERKEDIPLLAEHFVRKLTAQYNLPPVSISPGACELLKSLPYTGNIRELKNLVERTLLISGNTILTEEDFRQHISYTPEEIADAVADTGNTLENVEKQTILHTLEKYRYNISQAASVLGISRGALYRRMEKYNIKTDEDKTT